MDHSRRTFLRNSVIGLGAISAIGAGAYLLSRPDKKQLTENQIIIPGTATIDLDEMQFGCSKEAYKRWLRRSDWEIDYSRLNFDAKKTDIDMLWRHTDSTHRSIAPAYDSNTELAILGKKFDDITIEDLASSEVKYSSNPIIADDDPLDPGTSQLNPGTVVGIRTGNGNYAKLRIDDYLTLKRGGLVNWHRGTTERPLYDLLCTLVVYKPQ